MLIDYTCKTCGNNISKLVKSINEARGVIPCGNCAGFLERIISGPSTNAIEIIDNGNMVKSVEFDVNRAEQRKIASNKFLRDQEDKKE